MRIYGFAFGSGNVSAWTLWKIKNIDCCYQIFPNNLDRYIEMLLRDQPECILGLGVYSGVDQDKIRIETKYTNKFRDDFIDSSSLQEFNINPYLKPSILSKYSNSIGDTYCNLVSWKILQLIIQKKLQSQYCFLHIPTKIKVWTVAKEIMLMIEELKRRSE